MANMNYYFSPLNDVNAEPAWMRDERLDYCDQDRGLLSVLRNLFQRDLHISDYSASFHISIY